MSSERAKAMWRKAIDAYDDAYSEQITAGTPMGFRSDVANEAAAAVIDKHLAPPPASADAYPGYQATAALSAMSPAGSRRQKEISMINIMLDLETWGKRPGCDLRSIGACVFDPLTGFIHDGSLGTIRPFYQAVDNPSNDPDHPMANPTGRAWHHDGFDAFRKYPLTRDPETVKWWNDQSAEAQAAFTDPIDLADGLRSLGKWLRAVSPISDYYDIGEHDRRFPDDIRIYAHGPQFDISILEAAYHACNLPAPWHYRAPRDTRTVFDIAGIDDHSGFMAMFNTGTHHHALDDAISQAKAVCAAMRIIWTNRETGT